MRTPIIATQPDDCRAAKTHGTLQLFGRAATVALVCGLIGFLLPARASAQGCVQIPLGAVVIPQVNPCTGEPIAITAHARAVECTRSDANGGSHVTIRILVHGTSETVPVAAGVTAKKHTFNSETVVEENFANFPIGTFESTTVVNWVLIRQSEGQPPALFTEDDFLVKSTLHTTIPVAALPTASVENVRASCMTSPASQ